MIATSLTHNQVVSHWLYGVHISPSLNEVTPTMNLNYR